MVGTAGWSHRWPAYGWGSWGQLAGAPTTPPGPTMGRSAEAYNVASVRHSVVGGGPREHGQRVDGDRGWGLGQRGYSRRRDGGRGARQHGARKARHSGRWAGEHGRPGQCGKRRLSNRTPVGSGTRQGVTTALPEGAVPASSRRTPACLSTLTRTTRTPPLPPQQSSEYERTVACAWSPPSTAREGRLSAWCYLQAVGRRWPSATAQRRRAWRRPIRNACWRCSPNFPFPPGATRGRVHSRPSDLAAASSCGTTGLTGGTAVPHRGQGIAGSPARSPPGPSVRSRAPGCSPSL